MARGLGESVTWVSIGEEVSFVTSYVSEGCGCGDRSDRETVYGLRTRGTGRPVGDLMQFPDGNWLWVNGHTMTLKTIAGRNPTLGDENQIPSFKDKYEN